MRVRIGPFRKNRSLKIEIEPFDTWSMDYTLAHIIHPMLIQLKETTHSAPYVDEEDVPETLQLSIEEFETKNKVKKLSAISNDEIFDRWNYVLDEMIYAFDCKANKDEVYIRFDITKESGAVDADAEQERISNGFRLFGKYYECLWDGFNKG